MQVDLAEDVYLKRYYNGPNGSKIMSEVKHGDIIRYVTNSKGELVDYVKVFSLKDEDNPDYVKTGNEEGKTVEPSTLNKTMIAVSDGKYAENGHNTTHYIPRNQLFQFCLSVPEQYQPLFSEQDLFRFCKATYHIPIYTLHRNYSYQWHCIYVMYYMRC